MADGQILDDNFFFATWENNLSQNNSSTLKYALMICIYNALQEEFENKHLSGNLKNTIILSGTPAVIGTINNGEADLLGGTDFNIEIMAMRYDLEIYRETGQIVYSNFKQAGRSDKRNKSIINRLKAGKSIDEIEIEDLLSGKTRSKYQNFNAGSYAEEVDQTGGFSGTHKDYVERCIKKGIEEWKKMFPDLDINSNL